MNIRIPREFCRALALLTLLSCPLAAVALPDAHIPLMYSFTDDYKYVDYLACGPLPDVTEGCFASGSIGPFGHVGGLIEGYPTISGEAVQRNLYIVDVAAGTNSTDVVLFRYQETVAVIVDSYNVTYKLTGSVKLPLVGGSDATCTLAANLHFLAIGTDKSASAVRVTKGSLDLHTIDSFSTASSVSTITTNDNGYISIVFGGGDGVSFVLVDPDGEVLLGGGSGAYFPSNSKTGLGTKGLLEN